MAASFGSCSPSGDTRSKPPATKALAHRCGRSLRSVEPQTGNQLRNAPAVVVVCAGESLAHELLLASDPQLEEDDDEGEYVQPGPEAQRDRGPKHHPEDARVDRVPRDCIWAVR